jgi:hypothetical protein
MGHEKSTRKPYAMSPYAQGSVVQIKKPCWEIQSCTEFRTKLLLKGFIKKIPGKIGIGIAIAIGIDHLVRIETISSKPF